MDLNTPAAAAPETQPTPTPETTQTPSVAPGSGPDAGQVTSAGSVSAGDGGQAAAQQAVSAREFLRERFGDGADQFPDDKAALNYLAGLAQQYAAAQPYIQLGQQAFPDWGSYQQWKQQQAAQQQAQQGKPEGPWWKKHWNPPEFDPAWERFLRRDEQGNIVAVPGAPPDLPLKYTAHQHYLQSQTEKLLRNPLEFIDNTYSERVQQIVQEHIDNAFRQHQERQYAQQFVGGADWMYHRDQNGQRLGLNEWGQRFGQYVQQAEKVGIRDVQAQKDYALTAVQRDFAVARLQQPTPQQQGDAAKQDLLNRGRLPQHGGSLNNGAPNGTNGVPQNGSLRLEELIEQNLRAAGVRIPEQLV